MLDFINNLSNKTKIIICVSSLTLATVLILVLVFCANPRNEAVADTATQPVRVMIAETIPDGTTASTAETEATTENTETTSSAENTEADAVASTEPSYFTDEYGNKYLSVKEEVRTLGNVHVRKGPSVGFAKLGILSVGTRVTRIGVGENGWSKVLYGGGDKEGYVVSFYLDITGDVEATAVDETVYAMRDANIRNGTNILCKQIGVLPKGTAIRRVAIYNNGWSKVLYKNQEAFMYSLYLVNAPIEEEADETKAATETVAETEGENTEPEATEPTDANGEPIVEPVGEIVESIAYTDTNDRVYAIADANIRVGPDGECEKLGVLKKGEAITRLRSGDDGWDVVVFNGKEAFVYTKFLSTKP